MMSKSDITFSVKCLIVRKSACLSQRDFAKILGVSQSTVSYIERGLLQPPYIIKKVEFMYSKLLRGPRGLHDGRN